MKNKLSDLNDHLFMQLERLSDESLTAEQIDMEVERAKAIAGVSDQIIMAAALQFKAAELVAKHGRGVSDMIPESMAGRQIEHVKKPMTDEERERAEADARRAAREAAEERQERARQGAAQ